MTTSEYTRALARALERHEDWVPDPAWPRLSTGELDLDAPDLLGTLMTALFACAGESLISTREIGVRCQCAWGPLRELRVEVEVDDSGRPQLGAALAQALLEFSVRGWHREFEESLSSHSILGRVFAQAHEQRKNNGHGRHT